MRIIYIIILFFISSSLLANETSSWLKKEIDYIVNAYKNTDITNEERFKLIEETININFAGAGIAKFVAGKAWSTTSDNEIKKQYIKLFKKHLALNIASMMKGYSNQRYDVINSEFDSKNNVSLIDMKIINDTSNIVVTWRVKESQDRYFVIDMVVADISLVKTKRSEFNSILNRIDYDLKSLNEILATKNTESYNKIIQ